MLAGRRYRRADWRAVADRADSAGRESHPESSLFTAAARTDPARRALFVCLAGATDPASHYCPILSGSTGIRCSGCWAHKSLAGCISAGWQLTTVALTADMFV